MLPQRPLLLKKDNLKVGILAGCQTGDDLLQAPDELQELAACRWASTCAGMLPSRHQGSTEVFSLGLRPSACRPHSKRHKAVCWPSAGAAKLCDGALQCSVRPVIVACSRPQINLKDMATCRWHWKA